MLNPKPSDSTSRGPAPALEPIEVSIVLQIATQFVRPSLDAKGLQLQVEFDDAPHVLANVSLLTQTFINLLSGLVQSAAPHSTISLAIHEFDAVVVEMSTSVPSPNVAVLGDRKAYQSALLAARQVVESLGGKLVSRTARGAKGATVIVRIPFCCKPDVLDNGFTWYHSER